MILFLSYPQKYVPNMAEAILNIKALCMLPAYSSLCPYDLYLLLKVGGKLVKLVGDYA